MWLKVCTDPVDEIGDQERQEDLLYKWLIWRVLKLAFFSKKYFPCIYFGVWSSQNNAIFM